MPGKKNKKTPAEQKNKPVIPSTIRATAPGIPKWALAIVLLFTALIYSNTLQNGLTSFDDDFYLQKNPFLKDFSWDGIKAIFTSFYAGNYHPLTTLTYLFEYTKFGLDPFPYHLLNLLLHLANTWLVFKFIERLSGKRLTALVVCILFAIHPMHVESVAWVSERKDVLYTMFYLSSLVIYLRYIDENFRTKYYLGSLLLFVASLFSKSAAVTLPVLLIAIDVYKGRRINARSLAEKTPFLFLSILFGVLNLMSQTAQGAMTDLNSAYNFANRIFLFTTSLSVYFIKLVAPFGLSAMHFFPGVNNHGVLSWPYYLSLPFLLLITWLVTRRNAYRKEIVFGVFFFLITISVMLQIIAVGSALTSERYTYVPYIGLFYIAGQWIADKGIKSPRIVIGVFSLVVIIFSVQTWNRVGVWKNDETLFGDIRKKDPEHSSNIAKGFATRGYSKQNKNDLQGALDDYSQAILFDPGFEDFYLKRGVVYYALGDLKSAIGDYSKIIELKPRYTEIYNYRGWAYFQSGDAQSAMQDYNKAISLNPGFAEAYNNRGWTYYKAGNKQAAMLDYNKAISLNPRLSGAYNNRGWAYYEAGDTRSAILDYDKAISLDPKNTLAYSNLAAIKANTGDLTGAIVDYDSLIKLNPKDDVAYNELAFVRLNLKDTAGACTDWKKAAELGNVTAPQMVKQYCR
jgi:Flp pilus assembly protein TadD